jgi:hypothetical protein
MVSINVVIVHKQIEHGADVGKAVALFLSETVEEPWVCTVRVRRNPDRTTDDYLKRYEG